jgi:hypothetical protein
MAESFIRSYMTLRHLFCSIQDLNFTMSTKRGRTFCKNDLFHFNILETGEIWSGSEGGVIKAWPWDVIAKSLSLMPEEKHVAALRIERSYIDLRNNAAAGNISSFPAADVKHMLADHSRAKVWCLTSMAFAVWYAFINKLHYP